MRHVAAVLIILAVLILPADAGTWVSIGPSPIYPPTPATNWSGRVMAIAVDPGDANHWLVGGALGGVWETHDGGAMWSPRTDDQPSLAMGAIAFAPGDPTVVYAGTGGDFDGGDIFPGAGLLRSNDGGTTWALVAAVPFAGSGFSAIAVDPTDADRLVAAAEFNNFSTEHQPTATPSVGIYKSTDGGVNWTQTLAGRDGRRDGAGELQQSVRRYRSPGVRAPRERRLPVEQRRRQLDADRRSLGCGPEPSRPGAARRRALGAGNDVREHPGQLGVQHELHRPVEDDERLGPRPTWTAVPLRRRSTSASAWETR
jgi:hypothetical protein